MMDFKVLNSMASTYKKMAQVSIESTEAGKAHSNILQSIGINVDDNGNPNDSDLQQLFNSYVIPWVNSEVEAGNMKEGDKYSVLISAAPNNVRVLGSINSKEGPSSPGIFKNLSNAATKSVSGLNFNPFNKPLFSEQTLTYE